MKFNLRKLQEFSLFMIWGLLGISLLIYFLQILFRDIIQGFLLLVVIIGFMLIFYYNIKKKGRKK